MDRVESSLCRLRDTVSRFVVPSAAVRDVGILRAQIELRQLALEDIEVIRCRLRSIVRCEGGRRRRGDEVGRQPVVGHDPGAPRRVGADRVEVDERIVLLRVKAT